MGSSRQPVERVKSVLAPSACRTSSPTMSVTSLLPLLLMAGARAQNVNWATGSYSATYGQPQPQKAWQPQTFSLPEPVARPQRPVARAPVSVGAGGYQYDSTGDDGYAYVHDTRGDFGPYKAFLARKKAQAAAKQVAPVQQAEPAVQQARPAVQQARPAVQQARPVVQQARPVVQQPSSSAVSVSAGGYVHDPTGDDGQAYVHDTRGDRGPYYAFLARKKQQTGVTLPAPVAPQPKQVVQVAAPVQQAAPAFRQPAPSFQQAAPAFQQAAPVQQAPPAWEVGGPATHNPLRYAGHTNEFIDYVNRFGVRAYDYAAPTYSAQAQGNSFTYSATF